jgi:hypothetical protein
MPVYDRDLLRLRLEACVNTILDVHEFLENKGLHPQVKLQLNKLKTTVSLIDADLIEEADMERIEEATNRLLKELKFIFRDTQDTLYPHQVIH